MLIIDINGKQRNIKDDFKVITDKRVNDCSKIFHENVDGELEAKQEVMIVEAEEQFVEVTIIGRNREWIEWYPLAIFEKMNPDIKVMA